MPMQASVALRPQSRQSTVRTSGFDARPFLPALSSAVLLWLSFPPADCGYLAWFALAPLFYLVRSERSAPRLYFEAWLGGELFWMLAIAWVRLTDPSAWLGWVVMATFLSLWWPAFLFLTRLIVRRLALPLMLVAPLVWLALEYVRAHILSGFPWYYLAHAQYRYLPLIQVSDLAGAWGLTLLIAVVNAWWVDLLSLPLLRPTLKGPRVTRPQLIRFGMVLLALSATSGYGFYRLGSAKFREGPRVALLQSDFLQELKSKLSAEEIVGVYRSLVARAMPDKPDLIVWPETSYPPGYPVFHPEIRDVELERQIKSLHPRGTIPFWKEDKVATVKLDLRDLTNAVDVPMLVGTITYNFRPDGLWRYNSAILFSPRRDTVASYHKLHLVPFGEYVPLIRTFPALLRLTPFHDKGSVPSLAFGPAPAWFDLNGWRFATAICFEDTVPHVVRRFFNEAPNGRRPDFLVNISNDGWFRGSSEIDMHLAISVFRAVEHRVPLARAVNTGGTAIIDGNGLILRALPKQRKDALTGNLPLDGRRTLYTATGDWLPFSCFALTVGLAPVAALWRRTKRATVPAAA